METSVAATRFHATGLPLRAIEWSPDTVSWLRVKRDVPMPEIRGKAPPISVFYDQCLHECQGAE